MGLSIFTGRIDITEPDGYHCDYERFILTANPDGSRTLRTVTLTIAGVARAFNVTTVQGDTTPDPIRMTNRQSKREGTAK